MSGFLQPWELAVGRGGWRRVLQGCSKLPSPAVRRSLPHHSLQQKMLQDCNFIFIFFFPLPAHKPRDASHRCSSSVVRSHPSPIAPQMAPAPPPCTPGDPARPGRGLTAASQWEKAQYLRRRRGQLKFNVQANASFPPLNQAAAISNDK